MFGRLRLYIIAFGGGALLALMINYSSILAGSTTPIFSSWIAHGLGAIVAIAIAVPTAKLLGTGSIDQTSGKKPKAPLWMYFGGIAGAFTVILPAIAVNGGVSLSGTIAFALVGQIVFGAFSDHFGFFGSKKRKIGMANLGVAVCVLIGSSLIVMDKGVS